MIADWFRARGERVEERHLYRGDALPEAREVTALVSMGGPMSVNDRTEHRWIEPELALIRELVARPTPVIGVCLGAQLVGAALGGTVVASPAKEIGWYPVAWHDAALAGLADAPRPGAPTTVMHWHGEMVRPPAGATVVAASAGCPVQAFVVGRRTLALQFHLEMDRTQIDAIVSGDDEELAAAQGLPWVQSPEEIRAGVLRYEAAAREILHAWLEWVTDRTGDRDGDRDRW